MYKSIIIIIPILNLLTTPTTAYSSVIPEKSECTAQLEVVDAIDSTNKISDRITFTIIETNCDFLTVGNNYNSSSISYEKIKPPIKINDKLQGEIARSSSMGPSGVVNYAIFKYPSFSKNFKFSFSFLH